MKFHTLQGTIGRGPPLCVSEGYTHLVVPTRWWIRTGSCLTDSGISYWEHITKRGDFPGGYHVVNVRDNVLFITVLLSTHPDVLLHRSCRSVVSFSNERTEGPQDLCGSRHVNAELKPSREVPPPQ